MKKLQCEVCGSPDIKKVSDDIFECQSCGLRYSKEEVQKLLVEITGEVKIDHSDEVENNIKRGEQFEQAGDAKKAKEYYNKALDIDADNEKAQEKVKEADKKSRLEEYFVIKPTIDPKENASNFLKQLATSANIACDIYKEIAIKSVSEKFYTFYFLKNKVRYDWTAVQCNTYYVNETVYKEKYNPNTRKYEKEPETKKVERVERIPRNGSYVHYSEMLGYASLAIENQFPKDYLAQDLAAEFERLQDEKYAAYTKIPVNSGTLEKKDGKYFYCGFEIDTTTDQQIHNQKFSYLARKMTDEASDNITSNIGGDYYENYSMQGTPLSTTAARILIPVQIIEYTYKGKDYVAISDLVSSTETMPHIYPCDKELSDTTKEINVLREKSKKMTGFTIAAIILFVLFFILMLLGMISGGDSMVSLMIIDGIGAIAFLIAGTIAGKARAKAFDNKESEVKKALINPRRVTLSAAYKAFFEAYKGIESIEQVQNQMSVDFPQMQIEKALAEADEIREFRPVTEQELVAEEAEQESVTAMLQYGIKYHQKKRNIALIVLLAAGIPLGFLGTILLCSPLWHYTLWFLALALTAGGFGSAFVGSMIVTGNRNKKIINYKNSLAAYQRMQSIDNLDNDQDLPDFNREHIREIEEIKAVELLKEGGFVKRFFAVVQNHKKTTIAVIGIIIAFIVAFIGETVYINIATKPYKNALQDKVYTEYGDYYIYSEGSYRYVYKVHFKNNNTYEYERQRVSLDFTEILDTDKESGRYKVRFKLFSGTPTVIFSNAPQAGEIHGYDGQTIYRIDEYYLRSGSEDNADLEDDTSTTDTDSNVDTESQDNQNPQDEHPYNPPSQSPIVQTPSSPSNPQTPTTQTPSTQHPSTQPPSTQTPSQNTNPCSSGHEIDVTKCVRCDYVNFSKISGVYNDIESYDLTTGEDFDVQNVSIDSYGVFSFTFNGEKYDLKLVQKTHSKGSYETMVQFDCYINNSKEANAVVEVDTNYYIPRLTWRGFKGYNFYVFAE